MALVTGGAVRVGREISLALGSNGYRLAVHYNQSDDSAKGLAGELEALGTECVLAQADLTRPGQPAEVVAGAVEALGRLDLLVNSAAILVGDESSTVELAKMKLLNVDAPLSCLKAALKHLGGTGGSVVNIGDTAGVVQFEKHKSYSRTQSALIEMTKKWALDAAPIDVRVNAVCPGTVLPPEDYTEERVARIAEKVPMGRIGQPADVARAVLYLAGADYVTGQILFVDGGRSLTAEKKARQ